MPQSFRESLRGCLEIPLFLRRGVDRFENSKVAFLQSCLIPLVLIPLSIPTAMTDIELKEMPVLSILVVLAYRVIISTFFFLGSVWVLTWPLNRKDRFFRFATAYNWLSLASYMVLLPYVVLILSGLFTAEQLGSLLLVQVGFAISFLAFLVRHALDINWWASVALAIFAVVCEVLAAQMLWN